MSNHNSFWISLDGSDRLGAGAGPRCHVTQRVHQTAGELVFAVWWTLQMGGFAGRGLQTVPVANLCRQTPRGFSENCSVGTTGAGAA
jgi:hypothetical protein